MRKSQLVKKLFDEFNEHYGREWESSDEMKAAFSRFMMERRVKFFFKHYRSFYLSKEDKNEHTFKMSSSLSNYIVGLKRDIADPYMSEENRRSDQEILSILTDFHGYVIQVHQDYRTAYPIGTEAKLEPLPEEVQEDAAIAIHPDDDYLKVEDVAQMLGLTVGTVYGKVQRRDLPHYRPGRQIFFKAKDIQDHIERSKRKSTTEIQKEAEKLRKRR
ncbi:helix-turn-helix domain-containing protein [Flaviaesturariibacter amylovorans]|uniref:Helix-turn-helix domain-containing protein n=1 Tax=Flaviaesturariibacter amylovorans TaxID=1084520 RepID=A0ABP8HAU8_9BACT